MNKEAGDRHAYLIIAHTEPEVLARLMRAIDDRRNDIYIHIDRKAGFSAVDTSGMQSHVCILPERIDAAWGDYSIVEIELELIAAALNAGDYSYLHLISGVDLPIKTQDYIHDECRRNAGKQFIGFARNVTAKELKWRTQHYFLYPRDFKDSSRYKSAVRYAAAKLQSLLGYRRYPGEVKKGAQWWSITSEFAAYVLSQKELIERHFRNTFCPDEMVIQSLCWNSRYRSEVFDPEDEFNGCRRYIPWKDGTLMELDAADYIKMNLSGKWFARKFSQKELANYEKFAKSIQ